MPKEIDKRNFSAFAGKPESYINIPETVAAFAAQIEAGVLTSSQSVNTWTGNPREIRTATPVSLPGNFAEKAVSYLQTRAETAGFENTQVAEYLSDPHVLETSTGLSAVHLQQAYKGIPVFLVNRTVVFNAAGEIETAIGDSVSFNEEINIEPGLSVTAAAEVAAETVLSGDNDQEADGWGEYPVNANKVAGKFIAKTLVSFSNLPSKPIVLDKSIFADYIRANLVIFYIGPNAVLGWYFTITVDDKGLQYDVVVSAGNSADAEILYLKKTSQHAVARGNVFKRNGGEPKEWVEFPLQPQDYPVPANSAPAAFEEWVTSDATSGINVNAVHGDVMGSLKGMLNGQVITFDPGTEKDQQLLNIFYFCNFMHDFFYLLGFNSQAGSFDGDDPLIAKAHNSIIDGTANMYTPVDGTSPTMNMGLAGTSGRHTALDADVVFHEYTHGVTNRLVGGRINNRALQEEQSKALGEGWSDYFALTIQNFSSTSEKVVTGSWVKNAPSGIRSHPYNDQYSNFLTYGKLHTVAGEHRRGELWCATLMHWTRKLSERIDKQFAYFICWQAIVDGLKLTNANPNFLEARNAILRAILALGNNGIIPAGKVSIVSELFWASFARFGMGINTKSPGPKVMGIEEDFNVPEQPPIAGN